jgi:tetratricopeptide (TPR) repeat protein
MLSLAKLGRFSEAETYIAEAMELTNPTRPVTMGWVYMSAGSVYLYQGEWAKARSLIAYGLTMLRAGSAGILLPYGVALAAWVLAQIHEVPEALERLQEGENLLDHEVGTAFTNSRAVNYCRLGRACLLLGQPDDARRLVDRALDSAEAQPGFIPDTLHLLGDIATYGDRFDAEAGDAYYRKALALAEPRGTRPLIAHCHLSLGKIYGRTGKLQQSVEHLTAAVTLYREMDMRFWLDQAEAVLRK